MKTVSWLLLLCLIVGVYVVAKIALRMLLLALPFCAAVIVGFLVFRSMKKKGQV